MLATLTTGLCTLAAASAAVALPLAGTAKGAPIAGARCATLTLAPGKAGVLRLTPVRRSLGIVSSQLAAGVKAKTKTRRITRMRATAYRYAFLRKTGLRGERVRILVRFGKARKVAVTKTIACTVRVGLPTAKLQVKVTGAGTVTSSPAGISCTAEKSPCAKSFRRGVRVKLTAATGSTATFAGWSGSCKGTAACTVTLTAARSVGASFPAKRLSVAIQKAGEGDGTVSATEGTLNCGAVCSDTLEAGSIVRLRAEPAAGSRFVGWSGACSSTASMCVFTVEAETTVTATFAKQGFRMAVSRAGDGGGAISAQAGGIDCPSTCSFTYPSGTAVTLTAAPDSTSLFAGWIGDCVASGTTCTTTMDDAKFIAASFRRGVTVTVAVNTEHPTAVGNGSGTIISDPPGINCGPAGSGNTACSGLFFPDSTVRLYARPAAGSSFRDWYRCTGNDVSPGAPNEGYCDGLGADLTGRTIVAHFTTP